MALTPTGYDEAPYTTEYTISMAAAYPTNTYRVNFDNKASTGRLDSIEALKQTIYCILTTERCRYPIYSTDYGVELQDLIGQPVNTVTLAKMQETITEALTQDDRISYVRDFEYRIIDDKALSIRFSVGTAPGEVESALTWWGDRWEVKNV